MGADQDRLAWKVHPAAERPVVGAIVVVAVVVLSILTALWMDGPYWGVFAFVILFLSLEAFFLPSRFELSAEGVTVHKAFSNVTRPWDHFRRIVFDAVGVTLSPFGRRHWLETYRAIRLRFRRGMRGEVEQFILSHIDRAEVQVLGLSEEESE